MNLHSTILKMICCKWNLFSPILLFLNFKFQKSFSYRPRSRRQGHKKQNGQIVYHPKSATSYNDWPVPIVGVSEVVRSAGRLSMVTKSWQIDSRVVLAISDSIKKLGSRNVLKANIEISWRMRSGTWEVIGTWEFAIIYITKFRLLAFDFPDFIFHISYRSTRGEFWESEVGKRSERSCSSYWTGKSKVQPSVNTKASDALSYPYFWRLLPLPTQILIWLQLTNRIGGHTRVISNAWQWNDLRATAHPCAPD